MELTRIRAFVVLALLAASALPAAAGSAPKLPAPSVNGPRATESTRPVYVFRSPGAAGFRCAFDSAALHRCAARYSQALTVGAHVLRVRAVGRRGAHMGVPLPPGDGDADRRRDERVRTFDVPDASGTGIAWAEGRLWLLSANPLAAEELDPATGAVLRTISLQPSFLRARTLVASWWLAFGDGAVWATLPNYDAVARIDVATSSVRFARLNDGGPFGVVVGGGSTWVATDHAVLPLDEASGALLGRVKIPCVFSAFVSLAYGDGAAWLANYDTGTVQRVTAP